MNQWWRCDQARLANEELVQNAKGNENVPSVEKINCTDLAAIFERYYAP